jgi:hypothetical protein
MTAGILLVVGLVIVALVALLALALTILHFNKRVIR